MKRFLLILSAVTIGLGVMNAQITSAATGNWGDGATWTGGVVPGATDDVVISAGTTVTINVSTAECKNLTIEKYLYFDIASTANRLVVHGNVTVDSSARLRSGSGTPVGMKMHELVLEGDLTVAATGSFDMRVGSGTNVSVVRVVFAGSNNSTVNLASTTYGSSVEEFNSVIIEKTGGAKVILASGNLFQNNNSSNAADTLVLISGIIETGANTWVHLATSSSSIQGASPSSYIVGNLGRGISNGGGVTNRDFPVGDSTTYRPINIRFDAPGNATGHYVWVHLHGGDANSGTSAFTGTIDKVSALRYYEVGYLQNNGSATAMAYYGISPTYSTDDGVAAGNLDLRVAYSDDARATWKGIGPVDHTTDLSAVPTSIASDSLNPSNSIATGTSIFVALARATGTTTNSLDAEVPAVPQFALNKTSIDFGTILAGETKVDSVIIANAGTGTLTISSITSTSSDFTVSASSGSVDAAGTLVLKITFAPTTAGTKDGKVVIAHNAVSASDTVTLTGKADPATSVHNGSELPRTFTVHQNYPNPFNPMTAISIDVPERTPVKVQVYSMLGTLVATVYDGVMEAGTRTLAWNAASQPSGVYFCRVTANGSVFTQRMMLLK